MGSPTGWAGPFPDFQVSDLRVLVSAVGTDLAGRVPPGYSDGLRSVPDSFIVQHRQESRPDQLTSLTDRARCLFRTIPFTCNTKNRPGHRFPLSPSSCSVHTKDPGLSSDRDLSLSYSFFSSSDSVVFGACSSTGAVSSSDRSSNPAFSVPASGMSGAPGAVGIPSSART